MFLCKFDFLSQLTDDVNIRVGYDSGELCQDNTLADTIDYPTVDDFRQFRRVTDSLGYQTDHFLVTLPSVVET